MNFYEMISRDSLPLLTAKECSVFTSRNRQVLLAMDGPQSESSDSKREQKDTSNNPEQKKYDPKYAKLYEALRIGNLEATREFLNKDPGAVTARISTEGKLPLHVASLFGHLEIVNELLQRMSAEDVALPDFNELTVLHEATYSRIDVAKPLIEKNTNLLLIPEKYGNIPITRAAAIGQVEMVRYLYPLIPKQVLTPQYGNHGATLLNLCYYSHLFDIALDLLDSCSSLAVTPDDAGVTFLETLASIPSAFPSGCKLSFWQRWIYDGIDIKKEQLRTFDSKVQHKNIMKQKSANKDISINMPETSTGRSNDTKNRDKKKSDNNNNNTRKKSIYQTKLEHEQARELLSIACNKLKTLDEEQIDISRAWSAVNKAAEKGTPEFITEVLKINSHFFWAGENTRNAILVAVQFRQARVFSLIHGMIWKNAVANTLDNKGNTLLHMAGLLAPSTALQDISGAALQMQRELQWFEEVKSITPPWRIDSLNKYEEIQMTARELFTESHKELVKQGEKWMKGTATSCSLVAALVATVVFAAAFTVPGGNDQNRGYPIFSKKRGFVVFILSDAVSLFSSTTSIIMFLGILSSRYSENDFLKSLPTKLIIGLLTLFISMGTMLVAFSAALFVMLHGKLWIVIPVSVLAAVPVISFGWLQFPLLVEMIMSTYGPSIFDRDPKPWLTYT